MKAARNHPEETMQNALIRVTLAVAVIALASCSAAPTSAPPETDKSTVAPDIGGAASADTPEVSPPMGEDLGGRNIVVGTDATYPPFESTTAEGVIEGIDPSLMTAICEIANCVAVFQHTAWDGIFGALKAGEFDVLMSAITILPEREGDSGGKFTVPYFEAGQVLLAKTDTEMITGPESLTAPEVKIGVQTGTTGDTAATELGIADGSISRFETIVLAVEALLNGDVDVVVLDNPTADVYTAQHAEQIAVVGEPFTTEYYGILVPAASTDVLTAFNAAIERLRAEGTIDGIVREWYTKGEAGSEGG
jgi:polar amino acid transport system substrate-binding protein